MDSFSNNIIIVEMNTTRGKKTQLEIFPSQCKTILLEILMLRTMSTMGIEQQLRQEQLHNLMMMLY